MITIVTAAMVKKGVKPMARAFRVRFRGREAEVVDQIKFMGHREFCEQEGISGYKLQEWFRTQPGCEHDSIYNYISRSSTAPHIPLIRQCALAINKERRHHADQIAQLKDQHENDTREIQRLKELLRYYELQEWKDGDIKDLYTLCTENLVKEAEI